MSEIKPYYNSQESKKSQVQKMFDKIAPVYVALNSILTLGIDQSWRKKAISKIPESSEMLKILDVASGTADMAILAAKKSKQNTILGIDISEGMLKVGRDRVKKMNLENQISLQYGDCEKLSLNDEKFDVVMASFGIRNFENLDEGLTQMYKVMKPGGKLILLEFSKPVLFPFKQLFHLYFKFILPLVGRLGSKDQRAYKYLYESVQQFPDYERLIRKLSQAGFSNCQYQSLSLGICCLYEGKK
ncbi:MAG: bifunctional demethylmenaquinone methyltransferase/2-methoxy-6-polyprenyl-1,4-benzoquinol methylase UbiE [Saprospiraceae bacterium]|nr:bifunctional demethylmenaquinone methyltransferase/2-methoxy-6-polyprenyl-1,4-benzoquinol methylase UbiE [Saprospiraceae bacterium]